MAAIQPQGQTMRRSVLMVDDSPSMRQLVRSTLEGAGFEVIEKVDGVEALDYAQGKGADLVLTDINMPNMDGIELVGELRSLPQYKFVPILVLTTESDGDMKMRGKQAGATGWIVKPFDPGQLIATINRVL
jgi:two-component system chemotaxis response regulator CheY